uniref:Major facilitator superfamily (MFS) profile domain-containing protein n=2 Tax=Ciona intestinalis TaxID=7719 RepID=H2XV23_CIOIN
MSRSKKEPVDPPEGGWGWFIVVAVFIWCALTYGPAVAFPVLYQSIVREFGVTLGQATWLTGAFEFGKSCGYLTLPIFTTKFGDRKTAFCLSIFGALSICLSSLAGAPEIIYIFTGFVPGFVTGNLSVLSFTVIPRYFVKRRMVALGLSQTGSGLGTLALAPLIQILVDFYGWRGALLLLGGLSLNCAVAAALVRPIYLKSDITADPKKKNPTAEVLCRVVSKPKLWLASFVLVLVYSGLKGYLSFVISFATDVLGTGELEATFLLSIYSLVTMISRIIFGVIGDWKKVSIIWVIVITEFIAGLMIGVAWFIKGYALLAVNCSVMSFFSSVSHTFYVPVVAGIVGERDLEWGIGIVGFVSSVVGSGAVPLIGFVVDSSGDVKWAFAISAIFMVIGSLLNLFLFPPKPDETAV